MNKITKNILLFGFVLTIYGYLCRIVSLYFFWESKYVGWAVILIGAISFLINRIRIKKAQKQKSIFEKIGIAILVFVLFVQGVVLIAIPNSNAYNAVKDYLRNSNQIKNEIGEVESFSLIPFSGLTVNSSNENEWGSANINVTVKGKLRYKDVHISLIKSAGTNWTVDETEK